MGRYQTPGEGGAAVEPAEMAVVAAVAEAMAAAAVAAVAMEAAVGAATGAAAVAECGTGCTRATRAYTMRGDRSTCAGPTKGRHRTARSSSSNLLAPWPRSPRLPRRSSAAASERRGCGDSACSARGGAETFAATSYVRNPLPAPSCRCTTAPPHPTSWGQRPGHSIPGHSIRSTAPAHSRTGPRRPEARAAPQSCGTESH